MAKKIVVTFKDIVIGTAPKIPRPDQARKLTKLAEFQIGSGTKVWRANRQGMWLGAEKFEDAPFSVDMEGNVTGLSFAGGILTGVTINGSTINGGTITGTNIQTAATGLRLKMNGSDNSYQFLSDDTVLAELKSMTVPASGTSGAAMRHGTGLLMLEISGPGEGAGDRFAVLTNSDASVFLGLYDNDATGEQFIVTGGLPTSNPGITGALWNDLGTVKVS